VYINVLRRGDPTQYSIRFSGPEARNADNWLDAAHDFGLPPWGARWRVFIAEHEGHRPGQIFRNWDYRVIAKFGDPSPEAPSRDEYLHARALAKGIASTSQTHAPATPGPPPPPDDEPAGMRPFAPVAALDDDIPF
jgi:hypothetical protein